MSKTKKIIITVATLVLYTVAVILGFAFLQPNADEGEGKSKNYEWVQSYKYINYTEAEKAEIYNGIGIDMAKLTAQGFSAYNEAFMMPSDWAKELHVIELAFENIYCTVRILVHKDEIGWERANILNRQYTSVEVIGLSFESSSYGTLRLDDTDKGVIFILDCSESPDSELYQEFLRLFFNKGEN